MKDAVEGLVGLAENRKAVGDVFNLGSEEEIAVAELAERVKELADSRSEIVYVPYEKAYEEGFEDMQRRVPDTAKVKKAVGFKPTMDLDGIIENVVEYYKPLLC